LKSLSSVCGEGRLDELEVLIVGGDDRSLDCYYSAARDDGGKERVGGVESKDDSDLLWRFFEGLEEGVLGWESESVSLLYPDQAWATCGGSDSMLELSNLGYLERRLDA